MSDPTRIREAASGAPDELRALFRAAAKPEPLAPAAQVMLANRVATIGAVPTPRWTKALPWLLVASAAVAGGLAARAHRPAAPAPLPPAVVSTAAEPPRASPAPQPPALEAAARLPRVARAPAPRAAPARPATPSVEDDLAGEERLLNEAHRALAAAPRRALALAEGHARRYPHGQLAAERTLIEIEALVALGRRRDAEARADHLRRAAPNSIYEERLDEILRPR